MIQIEEWTAKHPRWGVLTTLVEALHQSRWVEMTAEWHLSSPMLVALQEDVVVGFLRFVIQAIGVEENHPHFSFKGRILEEAKVLAFSVKPNNRRRGIGRSLQQYLISFSRTKGLYQIRSHSSIQNHENHQV